MMTWAPPIVHPSAGDMALMHGVATGIGGYKPAYQIQTKRKDELKLGLKTHLTRGKR